MENGSLRLKGSFSNDDGDGSEIVTIKINSRFFIRRCDYSNSLQMSNVAEFPEVELLETVPSLDRERKNRRRVFTSSIKRAIRKFHAQVVQ